jgi:hypothetical protein
VTDRSLKKGNRFCPELRQNRLRRRQRNTFRNPARNSADVPPGPAGGLPVFLHPVTRQLAWWAGLRNAVEPTSDVVRRPCQNGERVARSGDGATTVLKPNCETRCKSRFLTLSQWVLSQVRHRDRFRQLFKTQASNCRPRRIWRVGKFTPSRRKIPIHVGPSVKTP